MYQAKVGIKGRYKIERVHCANTSFEWKEEIVPWFDNLITDTGLNWICSDIQLNINFVSRCHIGSSNTVPDVSQTTLISPLANSSTVQSTLFGNYGSPDYISWYRRVFRFNAGVGTGNISEIGVGNLDMLGSRALILDGLGNPTTITKLSDEVLDVTYEFQSSQSLDDFNGNFTMTGDKGDNYTYTGRASVISNNMHSSGGFPYTLGSSPGPLFTNGSLGSITGIPSGSTSSGTSSTQSYTTGTYYRDYLVSMSISQGNLSGGLVCMYTSKHLAAFQYQFTPAIPKTSSDTLTLGFRYTVGRV